jgi:hypothetical protein
MSSNKKGLVVLGVTLAIGGAYYYLTQTKQAFAKVIAKNSGVDFRKYIDMDKNYLKARANAYKKGNESFMVGGITYLTENGKVKQ